MLVLIRARRLEEQLALEPGHRAAFYRRAGQVLPVGFASVCDVTDEQLAALRTDARLDVEPFMGDPRGYPKPLAAGDVLRAAEFDERRRRRA